MGSKTIASPEQQVGQAKKVDLPGDKNLDQIRNELDAVEIPDTANFKEHAENLAFMEEYVDVMVFPSAEKNAEKVVDVFNDGIAQRFIRGQWQTVKRKYLEVLARAKVFSVDTPEVTDTTGARTTQIVTTPGLKYPFEVKDKNPRGSTWLQGVLAEA